MEVVLHRTEPEVLWDEAAVGVAHRLHPSVSLELVNQVGERRAIDARHDLEHAKIVATPAVELDLIAGHGLILPG